MVKVLLRSVSLVVLFLVILSCEVEVATLVNENGEEYQDDILLTLSHPSDLAVDIASNVIDFSWSSVTGATYDLYLDTMDSPSTKINTTPLSINSYVHTATLGLNQRYYWRVIATTSRGIVVESSTYSFSTTSIALGTPTDSQILELGADINFAWTVADIHDSTTSYEVYIGSTNVPVAQLSTSISLSYTHSYDVPTSSGTGYNLTTGLHYWKIIATNGILTSSSPVQSFEVRKPITPLYPYDQATISNLVEDLTLEWIIIDSIFDGSDSYDVYISTTNPPTSSNTIISELDHTGTTYSISSPRDLLTYSTTYYWKVVSTKSAAIYESDVFQFVTPDERVLIGYVSESRGGGVIAGSTVSLKNSDRVELDTTNTNTNGEFSFNLDQHLVGGADTTTFTVGVSKSGRASSESTFTVKPVGDVPVLNMQQFAEGYSGLGFTPPTITITGISSYATVSSTSATFSLLASASANGNNVLLSDRYKPMLALVLLNLDGNYTDQILSSTGDVATMEYELSPSVLPSGVSYLEFVSYDNNNNQAKVLITIENTSASSVEPTFTVPGASELTDIKIESKVHGEDIGAVSYSVDSNSYARIDIDIKINNNSGLLVYRGSSESNIVYVGSTNNTADEIGYYTYRDRLPTMTQGAVYYYKFKYYKVLGSDMLKSQESTIVMVPMLPKYTLTLTSPSDNYVYEEQPDSVDFVWTPEYDPLSIPNVNGESLSDNYMRQDTLIVREVGTNSLIYSNTIETTNVDTGNLASNTAKDSLLSSDIDVRGKYLYWTVTSLLGLNYNFGDHVVVTALSYPTILSVLSNSYIGNAGNGALFFSVK